VGFTKIGKFDEEYIPRVAVLKRTKVVAIHVFFKRFLNAGGFIMLPNVAQKMRNTIHALCHPEFSLKDIAARVPIAEVYGITVQSF
jgi:hypothetical protein